MESFTLRCPAITCAARASARVSVAVMNVHTCDVMLAGVASLCLSAALFSCVPHPPNPRRLNLTRGICCPLPISCPLSPLFYLCPWPAAASATYTNTHTGTRRGKQQMWTHTMRIQGVFIMFKAHHKYLMAELWCSHICIKVKRRRT